MKPFDPAVLPLVAPGRRWLLAGLAASTVSGVLVLAQAFALAGLVVAVATGGEVWVAGSWLVGLGLVRAVLTWAGESATARADTQITTRLRRRLLAGALGPGAAWAAPEPPAGDSGRRAEVGSVAGLATTGVDAIQPYLTKYLPSLVLGVCLPALTVVLLFIVDPWSGLVVVSTLGLVPLFAILVGVSTRDRATAQWRTLESLSGHFVDVVRGLPELANHGRADAQVGRIRQVTERYRRATRDVLRLAFASTAVLEIVTTLSVALVAVVVGLRLADGSIGLHPAMIALLLAPEAYWPLRRVGAEFHAAALGNAALADLAARLPHDGPETEGTDGDGPAEGGRHRESGVDPFGGSPVLALSGLAVGWPGQPALVSGIDARLPRGLTVLTGASGVGKSSLLAVLRGELVPRAGAVLVGRTATPLTDLGPDTWSRSVAWQGQRPWLEESTIADNLRLGRPSASDDELWQVLFRVDLAETVETLPAGLETRLGEDGSGLSAGQRARLALARILLADRPFVLLDEPTAHLDEHSEEVIRAAVRRLARTSCVVVVAHRRRWLADADRVLHLEPAHGLAPAPAGPAPQPSVQPPTGDPRPATHPPARSTPASSARRASPPVEDPAEPTRWRALASTVLATVSAVSGIALTATAAWLIVRASEHPPLMLLTVAIVGVRAFGVLRPAAGYVGRLLGHDAALGMLADERARVYADLVRIGPAGLRSRDSQSRRGDLLSTVVDDVDALLDRRLRVRQPVRVAIGSGLVTAAVLWLLAPAQIAIMAGVGLLSTAVLAWCLPRVGGRRTELTAASVRGRLSVDVVGILTDPRELVAWQADRPALARLGRVATRLGRLRERSARGLAVGRAAGLLGTAAVAVVIAAPVADAVAAGTISAPVGGLLVLLPIAMGDVLAALADAAATGRRTEAAIGRLDALAQRPSAAPEPDAGQDPGPVAGYRGVAVAFRWPGTREGAGPLDLQVDHGAAVAIVGPSGSGKSTLAAGLVRDLLPSSGRLTLAGVAIDRLSSERVRALARTVTDEPYLFASSVAENVRLARPDATDEAVARALEAARLGEWLAGLPRGLDTRIGDGGRAVSGGERARIGLARALLADVPVVVFDEPTAHLDHETARAVRDTVLTNRGDRTIVWITHEYDDLPAFPAVVDLTAGDGPGVASRREGQLVGS